MDAFGFAFATAVLATVLTIFGIIDRIVTGLASEIRWSLAATMVDGFKAWDGERPAARGSSAEGTAPDDAGGPDASGIDAPDADAVTGRRDPGLVVPVQGVSRRGLLFGRLVHAMAKARRRPLSQA